MLLALELLRIGQLAAGREHAVLRLERGGIRADRLGAQRAAAAAAGGAAPAALRRLGDLQAGDEAFQIALLFGLEVAGCRLVRRLEMLRLPSSFRRHLRRRRQRRGAAARGLCVM